MEETLTEVLIPYVSLRKGDTDPRSAALCLLNDMLLGFHLRMARSETRVTMSPLYEHMSIYAFPN